MSEKTMTVQEQTVSSVPPSAALNVWTDTNSFNQTLRVANMLAKSTIVPQNYQEKPADCFLAVEMAARMSLSPIFVMQNLGIVRGKPAWSGQACIAMIHACGKFKNIRHVYTGQKGTESRGCYLTAVRVDSGETVNGTEVTMTMAKDEGWLTNTKWKNMPEQMLGYRAASFFARLHCPEALMGLQTYEEVIDTEQSDKNSARKLTDAMKAEMEEKK